jgi:Xaa-Pro dipeptidase
VTGEDIRQTLEPGMVFTIEPGLYDPEAGGVRLENDLLCCEDGSEVLTSAAILYL